ncbi:MAG: hypothetical protein HQ579_08060 [Candidatus Omnitrophica bacterium]|nr:hypothetical protein [Candidatus Omnitrophota bacterium]
MLKNKLYVLVIGFIEVLIGFATLSGLMVSLLRSTSNKPMNVFLFVLMSALVTTILGIGLLRYKQWARTLLIFFSGYIIITKVLIFMGVLQLTGELVTVISPLFQNIISTAYHFAVIIVLQKQKF